ncbi:substrate-binding periplasmic protein [Marinobacter confluentis]|uniref:Transporter substrate-binding domain-containing protein n=1 Tax=Marinobacter confluentis TaxID=1697557 RepID=A0A4Z1CCN3_9GAMM|nr:transporter substrate-binding domain-containing protein [Marinobacter confluentis]TGN41883.1 transporter substrate-binding domain-containing protein [Marinobacter confluentis]
MGSPRANFWLASLAVPFLMPLGPLAHAEDHYSADLPSETRVFRFNVSPNGYPPYLITEDNQTNGIMWTVVEEIAGRLGYQVEAHKVPRKRVDQMLLEGFIDGTSRAIEWTGNPEDFVFTDPIVNIEEVVFFPTDSPHDFRVVEDLFSLTLVTHLGYHYPALRPHFESGQIQRFDVSRDQDLFVYVLQGDELDAAIADRLVGQWILFNEGMRNRFRVSPASLSEVGFRIMLRPEWQSFARDFNRELAAMRKNGRIDAILADYR